MVNNTTPTRANQGQRLEWRLTHAQHLHFQELLAQLDNLREGSDHYQAIVEEMKSIPGYPRLMNPDLDTFHFVLTDFTINTPGSH